MNKSFGCLLLVCSQLALAQPCETKRELFIENTATKVWRSTICPQERLPFHTHDYARVILPEDSGNLKVTYASGREIIIHLEKQVPLFLSKAQGQESHQDLNTGETALHVIVVELKDDVNNKTEKS